MFTDRKQKEEVGAGLSLIKYASYLFRSFLPLIDFLCSRSSASLLLGNAAETSHSDSLCLRSADSESQTALTQTKSLFCLIRHMSDQHGAHRVYYDPKSGRAPKNKRKADAAVPLMSTRASSEEHRPDVSPIWLIICLKLKEAARVNSVKPINVCAMTDWFCLEYKLEPFTVLIRVGMEWIAMQLD